MTLGMWSIATALMSAVLLWVFFKAAPKLGLLDVPNYRSAHVTPKLRGGGIVFFVPMLVAAAVFGLPANVPVLAIGAGILLAGATGFMDDLHSRSPKLKLMLYFIAGLAVIPLCQPGREMVLFPGVVLSGALLIAFALVSVVWVINAVNFMDGIDGLIASQGLLWSAALLMLDPDFPAAPLLVSLAIGTAVFLTVNWAPARAFMGDVGSVAIGSALGFVACWMSLELHVSPWLTFAPAAPILVDATLTLVARVLSRLSPTEAHRDHVYQRLHTSGWSPPRIVFNYSALALVCTLLVLMVPADGLGFIGWLPAIATWGLVRLRFRGSTNHHPNRMIA